MVIEKVGGVYIKRDKFWGDRVIYPWKNEDGSINWFNFTTGGAWGKLLTGFIIMLIILAMVYSYQHDVKEYRNIATQCVEKPCHWCEVVQQSNQVNKQYYNISFNYSDIKLRL